MFSLLLIVTAALLNRLRGGGFGPGLSADALPGRALFWVAPAMGLLTWCVAPWPIAAALALTYLVWAMFSWGHLLAALGGFKPERSPSVVEDICMLLPGTVPPVFLRMLFVAPGLALIAWLKAEPLILVAAPVFAAAATATYGLLFRPMHALDWTRAELVTGALWGALILTVASV